MEILSRTFLPIVPIECDELARKEDVGAHFGATAPIHAPCVGNLWCTPTGELSVWTGTVWLPISGAPITPPGPGDWDGGDTWDGGSTWG